MQTCGGQWRGWRRGRGADWSGNLKTAPRVARNLGMHLGSFVASHQLAHTVAQIQIFNAGLPLLLSFHCRVFGGGRGLFLPVVVSKAALLYFLFLSLSEAP